ncbi:hypothetical protein TNCV_2568561 [Trichonephila clavipes]|uniref:Uncharacterized protein n=1 Tax=Trichonephila clavipes TaxID=2585209 RepID=A0A8X6WKV4_TRICX|nr:hypothetical protein TNCV_2568561 [Trichonephila clavipes]
MSSRRTSRACLLTVAGCLRMSEPLTLETAQRIRNLYLFGDTEERYHQPTDRSGLTPLPPVYSEAWAKENVEVCLSHQSPPNGRSMSQRERKGSPEHHFPPYVTPHTADRKTNGVTKKTIK